MTELDAAPGSAHPGGAPAPSSRRWLILAVLCLSVVLIGVSYTILYVAVPDLMAELGASAGQVQWVVAIYSVVFAGLVVAAGSIGDRFGRRRVLVIGLVVFGVTSAFGAASQDVGQLIVARALMGVGAAMVMPGTLSTLAVVFPGEERVKAVGIWSGVGGAGFVFGPLVAGVLLTHFWWGSTLLFNVPVVIVTLVAVLVLVPESRDPGATPLDPAGAALSTLVVGATVFAFVEAPEAGWLSVEVLVAALAAVGGLCAFVVWELHTERPMLDVRLFRIPTFTVPAVLITVGNLAVYGVQFLVPQYLQFVEGESPLVVGLSISITAFMWCAFALWSPRFVRRYGARLVMATAMALVAVGLGLVATMGLLPSLAVVLVGLALVGVGMGLGTTPATATLIGSLPPAKAGVGSAMNDVTREVGGAVGIAVSGSIVALWYRPRVVDATSLDASDSARAQSSIGAALDLARSLGGKAGTALREAAVGAFTGGVRLATVVAAVAVLAVGVLTWVWLPHTDGADPG